VQWLVTLRAQRTARSRYLTWLKKGMEPIEAGNLAARDVGLPAATQGWTPAQIEACLFLAYLYRTKRFEP
jgi:hypothetical protein